MASTSCKSASLLVMLMLALLVASAQAGGHRSVGCKNELSLIIKVNGVVIGPGLFVKIDLLNAVKLEVLVKGKDGKWKKGQCDVPLDVAKVVVKVVDSKVVVEVLEVLGGLIHKLLKTVLDTVLCHVVGVALH